MATEPKVRLGKKQAAEVVARCEEVLAEGHRPSAADIRSLLQLAKGNPHVFVVEADAEAEDDVLRDQVALEVLCRVFEDGADVGIEEWRKWYDPSEWLWWARGLGAFIHQRLERLAPDGVEGREQHDCEDWRWEGMGCARCCHRVTTYDPHGPIHSLVNRASPPDSERPVPRPSGRKADRRLPTQPPNPPSRPPRPPDSEERTEPSPAPPAGERAAPEDYPEGIIPGQERWVPTLYAGVESAWVGGEGGPYYAVRWAGGVHMTCYGESREEAVRALIETTPVLLAQLVEVGPRLRAPTTKEGEDHE